MKPETMSIHQTRVSRRMRCFETPTTISFKKLSPKLSEMYIETKDIPGLLSRIGITLMEHNIRIHDARISTVGEKAEDVFVISDTDNHAITCKEKKERLSEDLIEKIQN
jgi:[protein-PII] uridylyltransferase